jgi:hydroxyethylthiazole kinase-like uncharacterized protein yjeF
MRPICEVEAVRRAEAGADVPEPMLMQRAAAAVDGTCAELLRGARGRVRGAHVVGLVGTGNNGGDALWALSRLAARGVRTTVVGEPGRMHAEGLAAARAAGARVLTWEDPGSREACRHADLVLDGILGIGGRGGLRGAPSHLLPSVIAPIVAVDVPSGVDSDTGQVTGVAVRAEVTVCFGVLKPGLVVAPGREHAGTVSVVDIGLPDVVDASAAVLDLTDLAPSATASDAHKYRRGVVGVWAGSAQYPGAALLSVAGARASGAGMVAFASSDAGAGPDPVANLVIASAPEVVLAQRPSDALCVGPGMGTSAGAHEVLRTALGQEAPVVVDASALALLAEPAIRDALDARTARGALTVLTPHAGEFERLGYDLAGGPLQGARAAAADSGCVVVLKGPGTVIAAPDGRTYVDTYGTPALSTAGTGDVLAGLLAGRLASAVRADPGLGAAGCARVAAAAVGLHGLAGRLASAGEGPVTALDVARALPLAAAVAAGSRRGAPNRRRFETAD